MGQHGGQLQSRENLILSEELLAKTVIWSSPNRDFCHRLLGYGSQMNQRVSAGDFLIWLLLSLVTFGIYAAWWQYSRTEFLYRNANPPDGRVGRGRMGFRPGRLDAKPAAGRTGPGALDASAR